MLAGAGVIATAVLVLLQQRVSPSDEPRPREDDTPARSLEQRITGTDDRHTDLAAAWVQFLRDHVADAVNGLNNRLNTIAALLSELERGSEQRRGELVAQVREEIKRATNITTAMMSRVTSGSPDAPPPAWHVLRDMTVRPGNILIVEDDDSNRAVMARMFRGLGHHVTAVSDGVEARRMLEADDVDCVLCDIHMPTMGGQAFYEQTQEVSPHLARRFVFVTGDYTRPESIAFLQSTGQPVIGKPFELGDLLAGVATVFRQVGLVTKATP